MPGGFPITGGSWCQATDGTFNATNGYVLGTSVSPSATANTKGAWTQLVASSAIDTSFIVLRVDFQQQDAATTSMLLDIGTGSGGSERVIIPNIFCKCAQFNERPFEVWLPLSIPAGTRIAARFQTSAASSGSAAVVGIVQYAASWQIGETVAGYEALTTLTAAPPIPTQVVCAVAGVKTTWVQVIASTPRDYCGLLVILDNNDAPDTVSFSGAAVDVGIGAGGLEQVLILNLAYGHALGSTPGLVIFIPVEIPAFTRVAVRGVQGAINAGKSATNVCLYGAYL